MKAINNRTFVRNWMKYDSAEAIAKAMDLAPTAVSSKAYALRSKGVKLPKKTPSDHQATVSELNSIIDSYNPKPVAPSQPAKVYKPAAKKSVFGTRKVASRVTV